MDLDERGKRRAIAFVVGANVVCRGSVVLAMAAVAWCLPRFDLPRDLAMPGHPVWDRFCNLDSYYYARIVDHGYVTTERTAAFFPAFPYLVRALAHVVGSGWAAGLVIANAATLAGSFFVYGLGRMYGGEAVARRSVVLALIFPTSLFFSCFYAEGLYFMAVAGALYFYERSGDAEASGTPVSPGPRDANATVTATRAPTLLALAGAFGGLAALTRPTGILLFPALAFGLLHRNRWKLRGLRLRTGWLLAIPAGLLVVMAVLAVQVGNPLAFVHAQAEWARKTTFPLLSIAQAGQDVVASGFRPWTLSSMRPADALAASQSLLRVLDLGGVFFLFTCGALALRRLDSAQALFILLSVLMPLSSGLVLSIERFSSGVVPVYLVMALAAKTELRLMAVAGVSAALLVLHVVLFGMGLAAG